MPLALRSPVFWFILVTEVCVYNVRPQVQVQDTGSEGNGCAVQCLSGCQQLKSIWKRKVLSFFRLKTMGMKELVQLQYEPLLYPQTASLFLQSNKTPILRPEFDSQTHSARRCV